jgi:hypothetical protein
MSKNLQQAVLGTHKINKYVCMYVYIYICMYI